ncbi:MAG: fructosamine kinase family protein [Acidobacteriota bacterium]
MDRATRRIVEALIEQRTGEPARWIEDRATAGGCIHDARIVSLADGRSFFVKSRNESARAPGIFDREAEGLRALGAAFAALETAATVRVPDVIGTATGPPSVLVLEAIETGSSGADTQTALGRGLAAMHRATASTRFGFDHDNYLGETPQPNGWLDDWVTFWRQRRLGHQLDLARRNGLSDPTLDRLGDRLLDRLDVILGEVDEPACLLHGDLWGGNVLVDATGRPVLIDPATYFGHREAELAMTALFGGFGPAFYRAYEETWPLPPGAEARRPLYELYHMLNHLNLFGSGYRSSCLERLRRLV